MFVTSHAGSHCPVAPLYITYMSLAGIQPLEPGFQRREIRPQLAHLDLLERTAHTIRGPLVFSARGKKGNREINLTVPDNCAGELVVRREEALRLEPAVGVTTPGHRRYQLPSGKSTTVQLKFT
jgi:alpha-L-rhamnosidase